MAYADHALSTQTRQKLDEAARWHNWGRTDQSGETAMLNVVMPKLATSAGCFNQPDPAQRKIGLTVLAQLVVIAANIIRLSQPLAILP